jgi:hypothetical protein
MGRLITKGSSSGSTLSLALRSKGEAGQPSYLIIQAIAVHFRPTRPLHEPWEQSQNTVIYSAFVTLAWKSTSCNMLETL